LTILGGELNKNLIRVGWAFSAFALIGTFLLTSGCDPVEQWGTSEGFQEVAFTVASDVSLTVHYDGGTSAHRYTSGLNGFHTVRRGAFEVTVCGLPQDIDQVCELRGLEVNEAIPPRDVAQVEGFVCISIVSEVADESVVRLADCN